MPQFWYFYVLADFKIFINLADNYFNYLHFENYWAIQFKHLKIKLFMDLFHLKNLGILVYF